jgi:peptidyl-prolyl cis-trans isomerase A (cyclophilin A)
MKTDRINALKTLGRRALAATMLAALSAAALAQHVRLSTTMGDIVVDLNAAKAPKTVANFLGYVKDGHYNGTIFHRVIDGFMIQGGGMDTHLQEKPTRAPIPLESHNGLSNRRGTIAMARTGDPDSATAQFFINVVDNPNLDADRSPDHNGYAVFGQVIKGMDVVDKIRRVPTHSVGPYDDVPVEPIIIKSATVEK